jgi:hypothetical protein
VAGIWRQFLLALYVVVEIEGRTGARLDPLSLFFNTLRQFWAAVGDASGGNR